MSTPKVMLVFEGEGLDDEKIEAAFAQSNEMHLFKMGPTRGVLEDLGKMFKFGAELLESTNKIVDTLLEIVKNHFAGSTIKIQHGGTTVEVSNAKRSDMIKLIDKVKELNEGS